MLLDDVSLIDIHKAGQAALFYSQGFTKQAIQVDVIRFQAIKYEIVVLGEAARRRSDEFRANHIEIPWKKIIGMRNVIVHQYDRIDIDLV